MFVDVIPSHMLLLKTKSLALVVPSALWMKAYVSSAIACKLLSKVGSAGQVGSPGTKTPFFKQSKRPLFVSFFGKKVITGFANKQLVAVNEFTEELDVGIATQFGSLNFGSLNFVW